MAKVDEKVLDLMGACYDRQKFYRMAAEDTLDTDWIPVFNQLEYQSKQFLSEIETISGIAFSTVSKEPVLATLKNVVDEIKETFYRANAKAIIEQAISADEKFLKKYESLNFSVMLNGLKNSQSRFVKNNLKKLKELRRDLKF